MNSLTEGFLMKLDYIIYHSKYITLPLPTPPVPILEQFLQGQWPLDLFFPIQCLSHAALNLLIIILNVVLGVLQLCY